MFGYVKAYKPELKVRDYEQYKAVYCSLCKTLGREYGLFARLTLSYDFTFAALLRLAERRMDGESSYELVHPFAKCNACSGGESDFSFTAAAAVIMMFYKLRDNLRDSGFWKRLVSRLLYPFAAHAHNKAKKHFPLVEEIVARMMEEQAALEGSSCVPQTRLPKRLPPCFRWARRRRISGGCSTGWATVWGAGCI